MKQMSRNNIIALALCLGVVAAVLAYSYLKKQASGTQMVTAVVATQSIPSGTILESGMLQLKTMPYGKLPPRTAATSETVVGKVTTREIKSGDAVSLDSVSEKYRLSHMVKPFMRAVTVAVDPIIGVGGFLKPGDHVDVLATFNVNDGSVTKTVLQDIQLVAIGSEIVEQAGDETGRKAKPQVQTNATLAVMPMDAEKLVLADSKGKIRLTLRRGDDPSLVATKGVTGRGLMGNVPPDSPQSKQREQASSERIQPVQREILNGPLIPPTLPGIGNGSATLPPVAVVNEGEKVQIIRGTKIEDVQVPE